MDCIVAGGTYTRDERGGSKTYTRGQAITVSDKEFAAFPGKFSQIVTPKNESREAELEAEIEKLGVQFKDVVKVMGERTDEVSQLNSKVSGLEAENADLKRQLEAATAPDPVSAAELKTNPAPTTDTVKKK